MSIKKLFALPLSICLTLSMLSFASVPVSAKDTLDRTGRSEEHTSELRHA